MSAEDLLGAVQLLLAEWGEQYRRYCYLHGWEVRRDLGDYYRICAECGHTYVTEREVLSEHWAERGAINRVHADTGVPALPTVASAAEVTYCPLCGTDWPPLRTENPAVAP